MSRKTVEHNAKKLAIKYIHEREALAWAFDVAFEAATDARDCDTVCHLSTLGRLAKQQEIGDWERWEKLRDEIEEAERQEDAAEQQDLFS
jgi:hypothetical protein